MQLAELLKGNLIHTFFRPEWVLGKERTKGVADCEFLKGCLFFGGKMPIDSALGSLFKRNYCQGDSSRCARYMVGKKLGRWKVPGDLYPMMIESAKEIIAEG